MSLIALVRGAISGKNSWADVGHKMESLFTTDVVDPLAAYGMQFASDFGKAALQEAAVYGPQIATDLATGQASQIPTLIPVIATKLEQDGIKIAETDALQDASAIIGNALRVQGVAAQITAATTSQAPAVDPTSSAASTTEAPASTDAAVGTAAPAEAAAQAPST